MKGALRHWNHLVFGNVDVNIKNCTSEIDALEARAGEVGLSPDELMASCNLMAKLWKSLLDKDSLLREKSRLKWIQDEDVNSSYLHAYLARRRNRNKICALRGHGSWVHGVDAIKDVIKNHFHHHFSEAHIVRPTLDGIGFPQVSLEDNCLLITPFTMDELDHVVQSYDGDKNPSPNGSNFKFIQAFWGLMQGEVLDMLSEFHDNYSLPKALLSYFVL